MEPAPTRREAAAAGARANIPLTVAAIPFGIAYGVTAAQTDLATWLAITASVILFAGASQLAMVELIDDGAPWIVAVGTALLINARFALYSAALAPAFREFPRLARLTLPYMLTDQAAALSIQYNTVQVDPGARRWFYTGAAVMLTAGWFIGTVAGVLAGGSIPDRLEIGFAAPLVFITLVVPTLRSRPAIAAAVVAATVAVAGYGLPDGLNIICGALAGIAVGAAASK